MGFVIVMYILSAILVLYVAIVSGSDAWKQKRAIELAPRNTEFSDDASVTVGEFNVLIRMARVNAANGFRTVFHLALTALSAIIGCAASILGLFLQQ